MRFIDKHIAVLAQANPTPPSFKETEVEGESPQSWFHAVKDLPHGIACEKLDIATNRYRLLAAANDGEKTTEELCVTILAWGGMRLANRNRLFERSARPWLDIAQAVRIGELDRQGAYGQFAKLRSHKDQPMSGMGPAYFTKLIYFLMPDHRAKGYILDQWAGLSINLISGSALIKMDESVFWKTKRKSLDRVVNSRVSDINTAQDYERFCCAIEALTGRLGAEWTPGQTERALMSGTGETWRQYVVAERFGALPALTTPVED